MENSPYLYILKLKCMKVRELKNVLENLDDEKEIEILVSEWDRVGSRSNTFLGLKDCGEFGYELEFGEGGLDDGEI